MTRNVTGAIVACLLSLVLAVGTAAQSPAASPEASTDVVDRIDLPAGWQPEGIATDGTSLFVGSLADGAIWRGDPATGTGDTFIPGSEGAVAVGLEYEATGGRLWVAGGGTGEVRVYDAATGELLGTYPVEGAGFLNDVAVTQDAAYVTDSMAASLVVIPIGQDGTLAGAEEVTLLELGGAYEHVADSFNLNGIVATSDALLTVQSSSGTLYRVDPASGEATLVDTGGYALMNGDGLETDDGTLYAVRNQDGLVAVLDLAEDLSAATLLTEMTSPDLDVPSTVALVSDALWVANARFGTPPGPDTEYWVTRLPLPDEPTVAGSPAVSEAPGATDSPAPDPVAEAIDVGLVEFDIRMPRRVPAGEVRFVVRNRGTVEHNFEVEGQGIEEVFPRNLQPGGRRRMTVILEPGTYTVYCPVGGHRGQGMEIQLRVR